MNTVQTYSHMKTCMKCYAENDQHYAICRTCGNTEFMVEEESLVPCKYCGADVKEEDRECYSCHHSLD